VSSGHIWGSYIFAQTSTACASPKSSLSVINSSWSELAACIRKRAIILTSKFARSVKELISNSSSFNLIRRCNEIHMSIVTVVILREFLFVTINTQQCGQERQIKCAC
jgi:hypothetical protein